MSAVVIERGPSSDQGCFGNLWTRGLKLYSGELPDRGNRPMVSCILAGIYDVVWALSPRLKRYTYRLVGVPGHAGILMHPANFMGDAAKGFKCQLLGCIALGERVGVMAGQQALLLSAPALRRFESYLGHAPFKLEIRQ